jgi:hypothetical protein
MSLDLSPYAAIRSNFFIKLTTYNNFEIDEVITFSDYHRPIDIDGVTYTGLGQLLSVTESQSDLRITDSEVTVAISGIPADNITTFLNQEIRGSRLQITRGMFDPTTGILLDISGNPAGRFNGFVNNFAITEEVDTTARTSSITISLIANSTVGLLNNKLAGRATNPLSQKALFPGDVSFDRVPNIANANYNFGAP